MKKFLIASAVATLATVSSLAAQAETILVNGDGSELSSKCIAAVESDNHGLSAGEMNELLCNGTPIKLFVSKTRKAMTKTSKVVALTLKDESAASQLCMAAVESEEAYEATRKELFSRFADVENSVLCNNMPIKAFARKYRNRAITAGL